MAVNTALFWISIASSIFGLNASGELSILQSPNSLKFIGSNKAPESIVKEIYSAALGLSVEENSEWNGLVIVDPFNTPEAVVEVYIDGVSSLGNAADLKSKNYPLIVDEYEPATFNQVGHRIKQKFSTGDSRLVNINLSDPNELTAYDNIFGKIQVPKVHKQSLQHLKPTIEEDFQFLNELEAMKAINEKVKTLTPDNAVDFYNFRFRSLHLLSDFHGPNSLATKEAKKLLGEALEDLTASFVKAYDGSVLVTAVTTDIAHTRQRVPRSTRQDPSATEHSDDGYSADYAAIFNIILWFGVVFSFTLVAIVYALVDMDPGRDSIIYRMTSTRMKKDN